MLWEKKLSGRIRYSHLLTLFYLNGVCHLLNVEHSKDRTMRIFVFVCGLVVSTLAWCEQSTDSTGDYAMDLGQVYGAVQSVMQMKDICSESFPELTQENETAYKNWRKHYLPFLQEVDKHWAAFAFREANGDPQKHVDFLNKMTNYFEQYKQGLHKQLSADGPDVFAKKCGMYAKYLTTDRTNLEYFYAEQVATMRRGSAKK